MTHNKQCSMERKIRKRRILEKIDACIGVSKKGGLVIFTLTIAFISGLIYLYK